MTNKMIIGIDISPTTIGYGVLNSDGELFASGYIDTNREPISSAASIEKRAAKKGIRLSKDELAQIAKDNDVTLLSNIKKYDHTCDALINQYINAYCHCYFGVVNTVVIERPAFGFSGGKSKPSTQLAIGMITGILLNKLYDRIGVEVKFLSVGNVRSIVKKHFNLPGKIEKDNLPFILKDKINNYGPLKMKPRTTEKFIKQETDRADAVALALAWYVKNEQ